LGSLGSTGHGARLIQACVCYSLCEFQRTPSAARPLGALMGPCLNPLVESLIPWCSRCIPLVESLIPVGVLRTVRVIQYLLSHTLACVCYSLCEFRRTPSAARPLGALMGPCLNPLVESLIPWCSTRCIPLVESLIPVGVQRTVRVIQCLLSHTLSA